MMAEPEPPRIDSDVAALVRAPDSRPRLSLVVLPFKNLGSPGGDRLAETITDELAAGLSGWSPAFVIAGSSAGIRVADPMDVRRVGMELGVGYAIHGGVQETEDRISVNVQLIDAGTGAHLWADRYDIDRGPAARDAVADRLMGDLVRHLAEDAKDRIEEIPPRDWSSDDLHVRGRAFMLLPQSLANRRVAIDSFERALDRDPGSVDIGIEIANALIANILDGWSAPLEEDVARAERLLPEAIHGGIDLPRAHACMGKLRRIQGRLSDARIELEVAIEGSPNYAHAMNQLGMVLVFLGLPETAAPWFERGLRLAPRGHDAHTPHAALGLCHLMLGDPESAVAWLRRARVANTQTYYIHLWLAGALGLRDELEEAGAALRRSIEIKPDIDSLTALRARWRMMTASPRFFKLAEKTVIAGLQRAGLPEGE